MDSTAETRLALIRKWAVKYSLDPALVAAVCEQESAWNQWAVRYEPAFFSHYIQPMLNNNTLHTMTEATMRATSFSYMQVMGQVAREMGFSGQFLTQLFDPEIGLDMGCKVLRHKLDAASSVEGGLALYNGGADKSYPAEVLARVSKYKEDQ